MEKIKEYATVIWTWVNEKGKIVPEYVSKYPKVALIVFTVCEVLTIWYL